MSKKIAVLSDLHSGHKAGLTHPGFLPSEPVERDAPFVDAAKAYWGFFEGRIKAHDPFDIVIVNGDLVDGPGKKSGGIEEWTTDMDTQCEMAIRALRRVPVHRKTKWVMTRGTPYHTGEAEDHEDKIAAVFDAKIGEHEWVDIEGVVFDLKHHPAGSSGVPQGRHTGVAKDRMWNIMWANEELQPSADVFIRSHVHYHNFCGGPDWLALTTPALQGFGSRYGARRCTGVVDFGFLTFEVNKGAFSWSKHIAKLEQQKATVTKL